VLGLANEEGPQGRSRLSVVSFSRDWELDFVMIYLDYVFPFLFPFYHPPLVGTGRAWLLTFLKQSDAVFHSVISLSSYFFTVGLNDAFPGKHENCKVLVWDQVLKQADRSFETIQDDLKEMSLRGLQATLLEKARLMESIIQLLLFDSFLGRSADWDMHLSPALDLFEDIFEQYSGSSPTKSELLCVLEAMTWQTSSYPNFGRPIWNTDQAAFRFFTAALIFIDIVASACLGRTPRLSSYHSRILGDLKPDEVDVPIDLSAFFGCQNWVLLAVSRISSLHARKGDMKRAGHLSVSELVERAKPISQDLNTGLASLNSGSPPAGSHGTSRLQPYYHDALTTDAQLSGATVTRVWAHAARVYLAVVVFGWQPSNAEIRRDVAQILTLLRPVASAVKLRALAWPICVGGCLSEPGLQEQEFRSIITSPLDQQTLSTLREAREIMEAVWRSRGGLESETWDLAACFRILGNPPLLV
jgi:hypothetical protein